MANERRKGADELVAHTRWLVVLVVAGVFGAACGNQQADFTLLPTTTTVSQASTTSVPTTTAAPAPSGADAGVPGVSPTSSVAVRRPCRSADELADVTPVGFVTPGPWPRPEPSPLELSSVATTQRVLSLTFDAEQDPGAVPALLDVLASHGILTTFFVLAPWAEQYPGTVRAILDAGHEVGNHSYAHERMAEWPAADIIADIERAEDVLTGLGAAPTKPWLRPGFGNRSEASVATAFSQGWTTVRWSGGSNDFVEGTPEEVEDSICADLLELAAPGSILISHTFNPQTPAAVDRFVREMHDTGHVFVPLSVLSALDPGAFIDDAPQT